MSYTNTVQQDVAVSSSSIAAVVRNTYMLLGMLLGFSSLIAWLSYANGWPHPGLLISLVGFYGLLFAIHMTRNSSMGLVFAFALTGFMGYTIGPIISMYISAGAGDLVSTALLMTAATFVGLSGVVFVTKKDFSNLSGFLMAGFLVLVVAMVINLFMKLPALSVAISAGVALFASCAILFETSNIIRGGERNYILAAIGLFVSIYNLFLSLLNLLSFFSSDD